MKRKKRMKRGIALALVLTFSTMILFQVQAAISIDTERQCSVTFELDSSYPELKELTIPVHLYQAADVNEYGEYQMREGFENLRLDTISSETTAQEWEEKAQEAAKIVEEQQIVPAASGEVYDVTAGLKPGQEDRYGDLEIDKTLISYNASLGEATFVFSIEAEKDGKIVYSDVVSVVFDGTGTKSIVIRNLPAGAKVTVTEVYSGASYERTTEESQTVEIAADSIAKTAFENEYNHQMNGGTSVVNHFAYTVPEEKSGSTRRESTWDWEQQTDSTGMQK